MALFPLSPTPSTNKISRSLNPEPMSHAAKFSPKLLGFQSNQLLFSNDRFSSDLYYDCFKIKRNNNVVRMKALTNLSQQESPAAHVSIELKHVLTESQFHQVITESQESVIIIWMANWCRKCIYLKPKLEKLAAYFYPGVRFYCIDVNNVPYKLVARAGVTKMPTIQLWKDSKKQAEVIGGHNKAYLVVNEVREMIEGEDEP